jgi:serine/threonine protein kinase
MPDTAALDDGLIANRYRLIRTLGVGGMGQVWYARDTTLDRTVAVKRVLTPLEQSEEQRAERVQRAFREARNAARVSNHPNIVTVYDVVEEAGLPWIVMEYVPCRSLAEHIADHGALSATEVAGIARALLDARMWRVPLVAGSLMLFALVVGAGRLRAAWKPLAS